MQQTTDFRILFMDLIASNCYACETWTLSVADTRQTPDSQTPLIRAPRKHRLTGLSFVTESTVTPSDTVTSFSNIVAKVFTDVFLKRKCLSRLRDYVNCILVSLIHRC